MKTCRLACLFFFTVLLVAADAARGGGRGGGSRRGTGRVYKSRMPILIPNRNPASANYYENKDGAKIVKASHFEFDYMLGRKITFVCMATGFPRPEITWLKDGIEMYHHKFFQVFFVMPRPTVMLFLLLVLMLTGQQTLGRRGRNRGKTKSRVQIGLPITGKYRDPESDQYYNNHNGAKIILASHFDLEYVLGHKIAFLCIARGNPRPHITWYKDGSEIYTHLYMHTHEWQIGDDRVKSKLEIDPATQMDAGVYECMADNMYSIDRRSFKTDFSIAFD
ncbi:immunoglobulin domain-containing protein oig-4-like [Ceratina calcarata]|uniref:Immunoglobulin domain-containing protein oig-4-like n=1 Tax=Ceratina calcarata TaxID=156304 RepID=A0AAJ7J6G2_9HYME|nr:immunoglobulin domain-containing protein oig-4-like [Ceratina calcarata]